MRLDAYQGEAPVGGQLVEVREHRRLVDGRQRRYIEVVAQLDAGEALAVVGRVSGCVPDDLE
jgi:hypothetical protein